VSAVGIFWTAAGVVVALLALVEGIARWGGGAFLTSVVLGEDKRTSTSKTFILLWTLLVVWALVSLLIAGELVSKHACAAGKPSAAAMSCTQQNDQVGLMQLGWMHFLHVGLVGTYLVLLGIPASAGVAAKGITQAKVAAGTLIKPAASGEAHGIGPRLAQIFSADDETTDIGDFQYVIFNLITAVYFVSKFVKPNASGLPTIPDTLLGLTGVSAALYVGKKAVARSEAKVTAVFPSTLRVGAEFTVVGIGLSEPPDLPKEPKITINGIAAENVAVDPTVTDRLTATVPNGLIPAGVPAGQAIDGTLQVSTAYGTVTAGFGVRCV
jgi:hypothetical protein